MNTYVALLRGINVGGHKKILMADLRVLLENINLKNIQTYIQSGNVVFQSSNDDIISIENTIKDQILKQYGFEVLVLVKTHSELKSIFDKCPFLKEKREASYFMLLLTSPNDKLIKEVSLLKYPNEEFIITKNCVYIHYSTGYGKAKCGNNFFENKLKVSATARNYKTIVKLIGMSS